MSLLNLLKKIPLIFSFFLVFLALQSLFKKEWLYFFLWITAWLAVGSTFLPLVINMNEKTVPIFQIFYLLLVIIFFFSTIFTLEIKRITSISWLESGIYGTISSILAIIFLMLLKRTNKKNK